ncbi:MAG: PhnA domain-containing protein [Planctomycetaceae bacterium]
MSVESLLAQRCGSVCELCGSSDGLEVFPAPPNNDGSADHCVMICGTCRTQIESTDALDVTHWRCLNESIWSQVPAVQVVAWRMLNRLTGESWAQELLETVYLDEPTLLWAQSGLSEAAEEDDKPVPTVDSNGNALQTGDSVTLIKDLVVKGGGFTAKRGTLVKNIQLTSNPKHVEGKVNGTVIVLVAAYLKKAN